MFYSDIFDSDNYTAIVSQTEQEYNALMRTFPFSDETVEKVSKTFFYQIVLLMDAVSFGKSVAKKVEFMVRKKNTFCLFLLSPIFIGKTNKKHTIISRTVIITRIQRYISNASRYRMSG